jgi:cobalt-zinc-cadmium efflux system membrane fusion protein
MKTLKLVPFWVLLTLMGCSNSEHAQHDESGEHEHGHADAHDEHDDEKKGPHGGRLLEDGHFVVEVTIFERGTPPEFRLFATDDGKPVKASDVKLTVELTRFGGKIESISFTPKGEYSVGDSVVAEPHSFDVKVQAEYEGKMYEWTYESHEGRTTIVEAMAKEAGVTVETLGPGKLKEFIVLHGVVEPDPARVRAVTARYPGVIQSVGKQVGESVSAGEALAAIESNESLQKYLLVAPIAGVITMRRANVGETASSEPLFEIADYSAVRAELSVFPRDFGRLKKGQEIVVRSADGKLTTTGTLNYLAAAGEKNQSLVAHVSIDNKRGQWTPGLFVSADVTVNERSVPLAVPLSAIQKFRDWDVVFLNDGEDYQAMPIELGDNDGVTAEVKSGVTAGDRYVVANSYLVKADIEKAGASHDH